MQKKAVWVILGTVLATILASITLIFTVGPRVSADTEENEPTIGILDQESYFEIYEGTTYRLFYGLSEEGKNYADNFDYLKIVIPDTITKVGEMSTSCSFGDYRSKIIEVVIPSSVTEIESMFRMCTGLSSIEIPDSVTYIRDAFYGCTGLTSVVIPSSVTCIDQDTFRGCTGLTSIEIPSSVTRIGLSAFSDCTGLTSVNYLGTIDQWVAINWGSASANPVYYAKKLKINGVEVTNAVLTNATSIGQYAFAGCTGLTSIEIPSSVTSIGDCVFRGCTGLTSIEIPSGVTSIGDSAFYGCTGLTSIEIPSGVTMIQREVFYGCTGLTSIEIPSSVTSIGISAFKDCKGLTSVVIPSSVTSIGNYAFSGCTGLTSIEIPSSVTSIGQNVFANCTSLTSFAIHCTRVGGYMFSGCTGLTSIEIPSSVTSIGNYAFYGCTGLTSVEIPSSVTSIGISAFEGCKGLTSAIIQCNNLSSSMFRGCIALRSIELSATVQNINYNNDTFNGCTNLESIMIDPNNTKYTSRDNSGNEVNAIIIKSDHSLYLGCKNTVIPINVTKICYPGFAGYINMSAVFIPSSVTIINRDTFFGWTSQQKIYCEVASKPDNWHSSWNYGCSADVIWNARSAVFESNGTRVASQYFVNGGRVTQPTNVIRDGYTLAGWYTDANCTNKYNFNAAATASLTLYAGWNCTVSFETFGGSYVRSNSVVTNHKVTNPGTVYKSGGFVFAGWYTDAECTNQYNFDSLVTENMTLYARWNYSVSFNSNGGTNVGTQSIVSGGKASRPTDPRRTGYTFIGWYLGNEVYDFDTPVVQPLTLQARWQPNVNTINFDLNGGIGEAEPQEVESGKMVTKPNDPTNENYAFAGWYLNNSQYYFGSVVTSSFTLQAKWGYVVTYDYGFDNQSETEVVVDGECAYYMWPDRDGYELVGWNLNGSEYDFDTPVTEDITLVAQWEPWHYEVYFDSGEGSWVDTQYVAFGNTADVPDDPTLDGYKCIGWYYWSYEQCFDEYLGYWDWTYVERKFDFSTPITEDIYLEAKWVEVCVVTFDANHDQITADYEAAIGYPLDSVPTVTREGYVFCGWYLDDNLFDFDSAITENITLQAKWGHVVTFDTDGGSEIAPQLVIEGDCAHDCVPTKNHHSFDGWNLNGVAYDFDTPVTADITLTARWILAKYWVYFDSNGGSDVNPQNVTYGEIPDEPQEPTREDYFFCGWYVIVSNGSGDNGFNVVEYEFDSPITEETVLTAVWKKICRITFDSLNFGVVESCEVCEGDLVEEPVINREGYNLQGWYTDLMCTHVYDFTSPVVDDLTLYAKWETVSSEEQGNNQTENPTDDLGENVTQNSEQNNRVVPGANSNYTGLVAGVAGGVGTVILAAVGVMVIVLVKKRK